MKRVEDIDAVDGETPRTLSSDVVENTQDFRDFIAYYLLTDDHRYSSGWAIREAWEAYYRMSKEGQNWVDSIFTDLAGYTFETILSNFKHLKAIREEHYDD